ncbi:MAG: glycosyltransferase family 4 protein [Candidatus Aenigmatarchaeota archaeon]
MSLEKYLFKSNISHLVIIGVAGLINERQGRYFVKAHVGHYLKELSFYFPKITFISGRSRAPFYSTPLPRKIKPIIFDPKSGFRSYINSLEQLLRLERSKTAILFQIPQVHWLPFVPLLRLNSCRFIVYVAGDWIEINKQLRQDGKKWQAVLNNMAAALPLHLADVVLVRGSKLLELCRRYNQNVIESLPIIASYPNVERTDTCQRWRIRLLYVGKLEEGKGIHLLLEALSYLRVICPQLYERLYLSIIGTGSYETRLKDLVNNMKLNNKVMFCGYIDNPDTLSHFYLQADILIVPSIHPEGLPRVVEEGLLYNLPVIATRVGGIPFTYKDREDLFLVDPGDAKDLAFAIKTIVHDSSLRQRLISNGLRRFRERYSNNTAALQHAKIILGHLLENKT